MKHELSACILILTLAVKYMHSVCVSSQLLVSVLFIVVITNTENSKLFLTLVVISDLKHQVRYALMTISLNSP